jgi:hypothetical protein
MSKEVINNGDLGLTVRTSINSNFTELYDYNVVVNASLGVLDASVRNSLTSGSLVPITDSGTQIKFDKIQGYVYGTRYIPITGNLTVSTTNAIAGVTDLIISASTGTPTFPSSFKKIGGTYMSPATFALDSSRNYIFVTYVDASVQLYSINNF